MVKVTQFIIFIGLFTVSILFLGRPIPTVSTPPENTTSTASVAFGWAKTWGGSSNDASHNAAVDVWGNTYVIGEFKGTVDFDPQGGNPNATFTSHNGTIDAYLSKFDRYGNFQWAKTWGGGPLGGSGSDGRDAANGIAVDGVGNVYVSGPFQYTVDFNPDPTITETFTSNAVTKNNIYLSKFSPEGTFQWVRTWGPTDVAWAGGAESYSLAVDDTNHIYVVGDFSGDLTNFNPWDPEHPDWHTNYQPVSGPILFDAFISKFDSDGNYIWAKTWGGEGYDDGPGIALDNLGNIYVAGMYASTEINFDPAGGDGGANHPAQDSGIIVDVFLSKFGSDGDFQWVKTWGGQGMDDVGASVIVDRTGNVYIGGRFGSVNCDFNPWGQPDLHSSNGSLDAFVSKFDANGTFQWARTWGGTGGDATGSLVVDSSNNVYSAGNFEGTVNFNPSGNNNYTSNGVDDIFFTTFDTNGIYRWTLTWGGSGEDLAYRLFRDTAGSYFIVGSFSDTVDFNPGDGVDNHTSQGGKDAILSKFIPLSKAVFLPWVSRIVSPPD
jgi:hypothetical protein